MISPWRSPQRRRWVGRLAASTAGAGPALAAALALVLLPVPARAVPALRAAPRAPSGAFAWLRPEPVPPSWHQTTLSGPTGRATLGYPPPLVPIGGDTGTVSLAVRANRGTIQAYLNVTPRQGDERLRGFPRFRVQLLGSDDAEAVHEEAGAEHLAFIGGTGSCVVDRYTTKVRHHRYREIACFVTGRRTEVVIVAAATLRAWPTFKPELERALASFTVS